MIAIFTVLGLVLFGGGAYAIFDGWPYMVLERGFTQVIIGSIASSAGLILLSLAWVLRELRAVRRSLTEAMQARTESSAQIAMERARALREQERPEAPVPAQASPAPSLAPVLGGAAVGAVAAGAAASAFSDSRSEAAAPAEPAARASERDLFGTLVARQFEEAPQQHGDEPEAPVEAASEPLPDMFKGTFFARPEEAQDAPIAVETESHEPVEIVSAKIQPVGEDEALAHAVEPSQAETTPAEEPAAEPHADVSEEADADEGMADLDEFSALRESLVGHLNEPARGDQRIEPSLAPEEDPFAEAEAWMDRASPRKEPWFEPQAANEPEPSGNASPPWPPRTEAHEFPEHAEPVAAEPAAEAGEAVASDVAEADVQEPAATSEAAEHATEEEPAASAERPASDEGIVGAYQVGDAHFTIYADGSIRARTPDGEFSFASMDELKAYLASEKNRLGA